MAESTQNPLSQPEDVDPSGALTLYLKHYPGKNDGEFDAVYGAEADAARQIVQRLLDEAMTITPDWSRMSLDEAGDHVESEMRSRHPNLSTSALESIGNYYTYLMR